MNVNVIPNVLRMSHECRISFPNDVIDYIYKLIHNEHILSLNKEYYHSLDRNWICDVSDSDGSKCQCIYFFKKGCYNYRLLDIDNTPHRIRTINNNEIIPAPPRYKYSSVINAKIK